MANGFTTHFFIWPRRVFSRNGLGLIAWSLLQLLSFAFLSLYFMFLSRRFCVCMPHEQFVRYLNALHKLYLAQHDSNCSCDCVFFFMLVRRLIVSIFHCLCDKCCALHYWDSMHVPPDYTPGTVLKIGLCFFFCLSFQLFQTEVPINQHAIIFPGDCTFIKISLVHFFNILFLIFSVTQTKLNLRFILKLIWLASHIKTWPWFHTLGYIYYCPFLYGQERSYKNMALATFLGLSISLPFYMAENGHKPTCLVLSFC